MNKRILVTGIGGVVGQGILKNIQSEFPDIDLIGTNSLSVSAGNHLCSQVYKVPFGDHEDYIVEISKIVSKEHVDLIIPSTDLESYQLGINQEKLPASVALVISPPEVTGLSLDKWKTYEKLNRANIPFASSYLPSQYDNQFDRIVVKPRSGRGSRDIYFDPDVSKISFNDEFVVQEMLEGPEITTTFYVTRQNELHGFITFVRELDSGNTSRAEVTFDYDNELKDIINMFMEHFECRGSINIQSKVTSKGIVPFEINSRISGTNSLRPHFGFPDVKFTVQEWLYNEKPSIPHVTPGCALRIINDLIYPDIALDDIKNNKDKFKLK